MIVFGIMLVMSAPYIILRADIPGILFLGSSVIGRLFFIVFGIVFLIADSVGFFIGLMFLKDGILGYESVGEDEDEYPLLPRTLRNHGAESPGDGIETLKHSRYSNYLIENEDEK